MSFLVTLLGVRVLVAGAIGGFVGKELDLDSRIRRNINQGIQYGPSIWLTTSNLSPSKRFTLELGRFTQAPWDQSEQLDPGVCLTQVSELRFDVQAERGASIDGKLTLDDLELYGKLRDGLRFSPWWHCSWQDDTEPSCVQTDGAPTMSFPLEPPRGQELMPNMALVSSSVSVDSDQRLEVDPLDLSVFQKLRFAAELTPGANSANQSQRIVVRLACKGPSQDWPNVFREVEVEPGRSSYALPLSSFVPAPYPGTAPPRDVCLSQVDWLWFEIDPPEGELATGTLTIRDAAFE